MSDSDDKLATRHSFYTTKQTPKQSIQTVCKSDINLLTQPELYGNRISNNTSQCCGEYYKKYEHDEIPVKDHSSSYIKDNATGDSEVASITNSQIDTIENRVYQNLSGALQIIGDKTKDGLDSISITSSHLDKLEKGVNIQTSFNSKQVKMQTNIEFFKTTVNQIFATFYESMQDFDLYKKKFNEILNKNRVDNVDDMEEFIRDIIQHITSTSNGTHFVKPVVTQSNPCTKTIEATSLESEITPSSSEKLSYNQSIIEDYKNYNYHTDSTDEPLEKTNGKLNKGDIFNIYFLHSSPLLEIKTNERNLVSEVNIRDPHILRDSKVASAENLKRLAAKRDEMEKFVQQHQNKHVQISDIDIPVRISSAKKDIHLDDEFVCRRDDNKSFMSKICNYFCKKFRKNAFA